MAYMKIKSFLNLIFNPMQVKKQFKELPGEKKALAIGVAIMATLLLPLVVPTVLAFKATVIHLNKRKPGQKEGGNETPLPKPSQLSVSQESAAERTDRLRSSVIDPHPAILPNEEQRELTNDKEKQRRFYHAQFGWNGKGLPDEEFLSKIKSVESSLPVAGEKGRIALQCLSKIPHLEEIKIELERDLSDEVLSQLNKLGALKRIRIEVVEDGVGIPRALADRFQIIMDKPQTLPIHDRVGWSLLDVQLEPFVTAYANALGQMVPQVPYKNALKQLATDFNASGLESLEIRGLRNIEITRENFPVALRSVKTLKLVDVHEEIHLPEMILGPFPQLTKLVIEGAGKIFLNEGRVPELEIEMERGVEVFVLEDQKQVLWQDWQKEFFVRSDKSSKEKMDQAAEVVQFFNAPNVEMPSKLRARDLSLLSVMRFIRSLGEAGMQSFNFSGMKDYMNDHVVPSLVKRLGHLFTLKGSLRCADGKEVKFEGYSSGSSYRHFHTSMERYFHDIPSSTLSKRERLRLARFIGRGARNIGDVRKQDEIESNAKLCMEEYRRGEPVVLPTGWRGHAINVVIQGDYIVITNRGDRLHSDSNTRVFKIPDRTRVDETLVKRIIDTTQGGEKERKAFFSDGIVDELGLELFDEIPVGSQKVGNCTYANNKGAYRALLYLRYLNNAQDPDPEEAKVEAIKQSYAEYKKWSLFDRVQGLYEFREMVEGVGVNAFERESLQHMYAEIKKNVQKHMEKNRKQGLFSQDPDFQKLQQEVNKLISDLDALVGKAN